MSEAVAGVLVRTGKSLWRFLTAGAARLVVGPDRKFDLLQGASQTRSFDHPLHPCSTERRTARSKHQQQGCQLLSSRCRLDFCPD
jgi:hypothetical protein